MKVCSMCNEEKSLGEFYGGNNPYCKKCTGEYHKRKNKSKKRDSEIVELLKTMNYKLYREIAEIIDNKVN